MNSSPTRERRFEIFDFDLEKTLNSGQAFRWRSVAKGWEGIVAGRWVRLEAIPGGIRAETAVSNNDWNWLIHYLQLDIDFRGVVGSFPNDQPMASSVAACRGLRLLRQDPWECLASFILSSTKQIVQIQQIVAELCRRFGQPIVGPTTSPIEYAFPSATRIAGISETELRACKMGFRAPNLQRTAQRVAEGELRLDRLATLPFVAAREELLGCPGVGPKIANCVLLFAFGFQEAFPVDVWVRRALCELYFPKRQPSRQRLEQFISSYFGPNAGYAQQYLFHYVRTRQRSVH